jgi:hypothetical protein
MNASISVAGERTVSVAVVIALAELVQRAGIANRDELLRAARISQSQLDVPDGRVSQREARSVFEAALELSGDEALGMHFGVRLAADSFAPVSYLIAHAATLRAGLHALTQFQGLITDQPAYELTEQNDHVTVRCLLRSEHSPRMRRFMAELSMCGFVYTSFARTIRAGTRSA